VHVGGPVRESASSAFVDGINTGLLWAAAAAVVAAGLLLRPTRRPRTAGADPISDPATSLVASEVH
jgi:hypothetical protein